MTKFAKVEEAKIAKARELFDENPNWGWEALSKAAGINSSTLRHIFKRRWGLIMRGRKPNEETEAGKIGIITESNVTITDLDRLIEQVNNSIEMVNIEKKKNKELLKKCIAYAAKIAELQNLLAQENRRH